MGISFFSVEYFSTAFILFIAFANDALALSKSMLPLLLVNLSSALTLDLSALSKSIFSTASIVSERSKTLLSRISAEPPLVVKIRVESPGNPTFIMPSSKVEISGA